MIEERGESAALRPLWAMTLGATAGSAAAFITISSSPPFLPPILVLAGIVCSIVGLRGRRGSTSLWFVAGLAVAGGHGLLQAADRYELEHLIDSEDPTWIRARLVVTEGWTRGRWGWRTRVQVLDARHDSESIPPLRRSRLEIRGVRRPGDLPEPGTEIHGLVSVRGSSAAPLLVASSQRLIQTGGTRRLLPSVRDTLARSLLSAAGTDLRRIRAAELAASLSLGRRDLVPRSRRDGWRKSGLAHVLAVSGLHVGLVAGMVWLLLSFGGASPTFSRLMVLLVLPSYALLAGGSPSAVRAAIMGSVYVGARLLGRAILPMAAVLLTATVLLIADPSLIAEISFQLTVLLTAALVRWAPILSASLPLPRWLSAAIVVPVVAQVAAAPIVAFHFASAIPGAAVANVLVPWLLGPLVLASVAATAIAPLSSTVAGWLLDITDLTGRALWLAGSPGRHVELVPPPVPLILILAFILLGIAALLPNRSAKVGAAGYLLAVVAAGTWWLAVPSSNRTRIELLPVSYGLSVRVSSPQGHLLMDGGGLDREAAELLAPTRLRKLDIVIASHGDEDHIGGLRTVLRTMNVSTLMLPAWLARATEAVPLIRTARRRGVRILPVSRGSRVDLGPATMEVLWPPSKIGLTKENERSLVVRLELPSGAILLTADIGRSVEERMSRSTTLDSTILVVPHHGSRNSTSPTFLDAVSPRLALIPAGPKNTHNHPHPEVVERLAVRKINFRMPIRDGRCGARLDDGEWVLYPPLTPPENR